MDDFGLLCCCDHGSRYRFRYERIDNDTCSPVNLLEDNLVIERLLEPGSTELPICRCGVEMELVDADQPATAHETAIRIFKCRACEHEMRLTVWSEFDGKP
jgi:hypothetical protein